ncbi:hypothetical protein M8J77_010480 [Diaphorina citri]|nr:hypothetical protein M8J77_010480 [Diaphorina citri]
MRILNWDKITEFSTAKKIEWRFNPPSGPWWGGFYERLIGIMKNLLKRVLGKSRVNCEELLTILSDCESVMNSRPISYMSEDKTELMALTPARFLQDIEEYGVPEYDLIHTTDLTRRFKYRQELVRELRKRFRIEYLGQLQPLVSSPEADNLRVGELVLIGDDNVKRTNWLMGRIEELIRGKDGCVRIAKVLTPEGTLLRPVQRLYKLEIFSSPRENIPMQLGTDSESIESDHLPDDSQAIHLKLKEVDTLPVRETTDQAEVVSNQPPVQINSRGRTVRKPVKLDL